MKSVKPKVGELIIMISVVLCDIWFCWQLYSYLSLTRRITESKKSIMNMVLSITEGEFEEYRAACEISHADFRAELEKKGTTIRNRLVAISENFDRRSKQYARVRNANPDDSNGQVRNTVSNPKER